MTYTVTNPMYGYFTSLDAYNQVQSYRTIKSGTYEVIDESRGMYRLKVNGKSFWINPAQSISMNSLFGITGIMPDFEDINNEEFWNNRLNTMATNAVSSILDDTITNSTVREIMEKLGYPDNIFSQSGLLSNSSASSKQTNSDRTNKSVYRIAKEYIPCYIVNAVTGDTIEFDCEPESFDESNSNNFDMQDIRGRSNPFQGYNNSGPRTISFTLPLHDDLCKLGILNTVNKLRALVYPGYEGDVLVPPVVLFRIGDMFNCKCIVNDVSISWQKPYRNNVYTYAEANISLTEVVDRPFSATEISANGGFLNG